MVPYFHSDVEYPIFLIFLAFRLFPHGALADSESFTDDKSRAAYRTVHFQAVVLLPVVHPLVPVALRDATSPKPINLEASPIQCGRTVRASSFLDFRGLCWASGGTHHFVLLGN